MKRHRLTDRAITKTLGYQVAMTRFRLTDARINKTTAGYSSHINKLGEPYLAPIQTLLNKVNGRAKARTISSAKAVFDCAIEVEVELRSKGVTIKSMKGTTLFLRGNAGFKGVSTGVYLEYGTTGWFVTGVEKTYDGRGKRFISITPSAREDIMKAQLGCYAVVKEPRCRHEPSQ